MKVIEDVRLRYACDCTVKAAEKPAQPIEKSTAAMLWRATRPLDRLMMRFRVDLGPEAIRGRGATGEFFNPVISPDGTRLVSPLRRRMVVSGWQCAASTNPYSQYSPVPRERSILSFLRMASGSDSSPARS